MNDHIARLWKEIKDIIPLNANGEMLLSWRGDWERISRFNYSIDELQIIKKIYLDAREKFDYKMLESQKERQKERQKKNF